jgi:hypothetical protein
MTFINDRLAYLDGALHHSFQGDRLPVQFDTAACDPRDIEHVVHQMHHCHSVALYDSRSPGFL